MFVRDDLHGYQVRSVDFVKDRFRSALHLDMSLGKTVSVLTALVDLFDQVAIRGALVVAPRRVAETVWAAEAQKWAHARHLRVCLLRDSNKSKLVRNLQLHYHIWVINYEALPWLFTHLNQLFLSLGRDLPFDTLVFDEITRVKNSEGVRISPWFKRNPNTRSPQFPHGVCMLDYFPRRIGLTGTPAPNGYWDLFGSYLVLDDGARLGTTQQIYKEMYFIENQYTGRKEPAPGAREQIQAKIADMTLSMQAKDYINLPPVRVNDIRVDLPPKAMSKYLDMEAAMFMELDDGGSMEVFNAAAMTAKCRQLANGTVIDPENKDLTHNIHDVKLESLDDIMEEASGQGVLAAYIFRADMKRIMKRYKGRYRMEYLGPGVSTEDAMRIVIDWNRQEVDLLLSHPQSVGHGLNLQFGGHQLVWFGLDYALEGYLQTNARLARQGQPSPFVVIHRILARDTIDLVVKAALDAKQHDQQGLRDALEAYKRSKQTRLA